MPDRTPPTNPLAPRPPAPAGPAVAAAPYRDAVRAPALVSILIVTYDHAGEVDACLDGALAQAGEGLAVEVIVADNASRDATAERVRARTSRDERVRLLEMGSNTGFAAAVNAAF